MQAYKKAIGFLAGIVVMALTSDGLRQNEEIVFKNYEFAPGSPAHVLVVSNGNSYKRYVDFGPDGIVDAYYMREDEKESSFFRRDKQESEMMQKAQIEYDLYMQRLKERRSNQK